MAYKTKPAKISKKEFAWYQKGYFDAQLGNKPFKYKKGRIA